jgi:hypothetical protein
MDRCELHEARAELTFLGEGAKFDADVLLKFARGKFGQFSIFSAAFEGRIRADETDLPSQKCRLDSLITR